MSSRSLMRRLRPLALLLWKWLPLPRRVQHGILWLTNTKYLVGVVGIVFDRQDRILVLKHTYRNRYPWGLPGGWVEGNEPLDLALARELFEETGFTIRVIAPFHIESDARYRMLDVCFLCDYLGGDFQPDAEIAAMRFCALADLPAALLPRQRLLIARALDLRRTSGRMTATQGAGDAP